MSATVELVPVGEPGALEADPVAYMALALNRAKGWLAEARSVEELREAKAVAVGYESMIREKELAFDAQLSATEIVRRIERRIGEAVRQGQREGTIAKRGDNRRHEVARGELHLESPHEAVGVPITSKNTVSQHYAMADAPAAEFEQAIEQARAEGNLSRANVVRKVTGKPATNGNGRSEWHRKTRHIDSNRVLTALAQDLDAATAGLDLIDPAALDTNLAAECVASINRSIAVIRSHLRRIK